MASEFHIDNHRKSYEDESCLVLIIIVSENLMLEIMYSQSKNKLATINNTL